MMEPLHSFGISNTYDAYSNSKFLSKTITVPSFMRLTSKGIQNSNLFEFRSTTTITSLDQELEILGQRNLSLKCTSLKISASQCLTSKSRGFVIKCTFMGMEIFSKILQATVDNEEYDDELKQENDHYSFKFQHPAEFIFTINQQQLV